MGIEQVQEKAIDSVDGYWRGVYAKAPEGAREYYRILLAQESVDESIPSDTECQEDILEDVYEKLDDESWRYILENTSGPSKLGLGRIWKSIRESKDNSCTIDKEGIQ